MILDCIRKEKLMAELLATVKDLAKDRLETLRDPVRKHNLALRSNSGGRADSASSHELLRLIVRNRVDPAVVLARPYVHHPLYPPIEVLQALRVRFSGSHADQGWHSPQIRMLQHYELLVDASLKKLPLLVALVAKIFEQKGLKSAKGPPVPWPEFHATMAQALEVQKLAPDTSMPCTLTSWNTGWCAESSKTGKPVSNPADNRALTLGHGIKYCIVITQWICPICLATLLTEHDLSAIRLLIVAMSRLHFDHCIPDLKNHNIVEHNLWLCTPHVLIFNPEKRSGCFVHDFCHSTCDNVP